MRCGSLLRAVRLKRPLGFALLWLLLLEVTLRLTLPADPRTVRDPAHPYGCFADQTLTELLAARADGTAAVDVVLLGDSVLASVENPVGSKLAELLPPALTERLLAQSAPGAKALPPQVRVWTVAAGGAHAADVLAALTRLQHSLPSAQSPRSKLVVVASSNVIFFSKRHRVPAMTYPCLAGWLPPDPSLHRQLGLPPPSTGLWSTTEPFLQKHLTRHIYLLQQRRHLAERWLGGPPREALREGFVSGVRGLLQRLKGQRPQPSTTEDPDRPWSARGYTQAQFAASYDVVPLDSPEATNFQLTQRLAQQAGQLKGQIPTLVLVSPQNQAMLGALLQTPSYQQLTSALQSTFAAHSVPLLQLDRDQAFVSSMFLDQDHLTRAGNQLLAARLAEALLPLLLAPLSERDAAD
jgi:lysophospholipase L1-like esterase